MIRSGADAVRSDYIEAYHHGMILMHHIVAVHDIAPLQVLEATEYPDAPAITRSMKPCVLPR